MSQTLTVITDGARSLDWFQSMFSRPSASSDSEANDRVLEFDTDWVIIHSAPHQVDVDDSLARPEVKVLASPSVVQLETNALHLLDEFILAVPDNEPPLIENDFGLVVSFDELKPLVREKVRWEFLAQLPKGAGPNDP